MNWVRSRVRQAALLALFALAVQIVLSFGHFHGDAAHAASFSPHAIATSHGDTPSHPHPDGLLPDGCAICAAIVLAGTVIAAAPPPLALPATFAIRAADTQRDMAAAGTGRTAFRSRAPPRS